MAPDSDSADDTRAAAADQPEEQPSEETEITQEADGAAAATVTKSSEEPAPGANASWTTATPPMTPERGAAAAAHDSEGSDTQSAAGRGSPLHREEKPRHAGASVKGDDVIKSGGAEAAASPEREGAAEHKEKGKERRKRFWK
nr:unnamed protein product [Digitaria exilis]